MADEFLRTLMALPGQHGEQVANLATSLAQAGKVPAGQVMALRRAAHLQELAWQTDVCASLDGDRTGVPPIDGAKWILRHRPTMTLEAGLVARSRFGALAARRAGVYGEAFESWAGADLAIYLLLADLAFDGEGRTQTPETALGALAEAYAEKLGGGREEWVNHLRVELQEALGQAPVRLRAAMERRQGGRDGVRGVG